MAGMPLLEQEVVWYGSIAPLDGRNVQPVIPFDVGKIVGKLIRIVDAGE